MGALSRLFCWILFCAVVAVAAGCEGETASSSPTSGSGSGSGSGGGGGGAQTGNTPTSTETDLAQQVLALVNQERANQGLAPLGWHAACAQVAYDHSWDMDDRGFFDHTNPDGDDPFDRMANAGISYSAAGENIAAGYSTAQQVMAAWMASPGHEANIVNPNFTQIGIGARQGSTTYWTQVFRAP